MCTRFAILLLCFYPNVAPHRYYMHTVSGVREKIREGTSIYTSAGGDNCSISYTVSLKAQE